MSTRYLRPPQRKIYHIDDLFTRIDELMVEMIRGLDLVIQRLDMMLQAMGVTREIIERAQAPPERPVHTGPAIISAGAASMIQTDVFEATPNYKRLELDGDIVIMLPEDNILISGSPTGPGFPVRARTYFSISRTPSLEYVYVKSATGSNVKVYLMNVYR